MSTIARIRVPWSGGGGGPGVSTFYALDATTALAPLRAFFSAVSTFIVAPISWTFAGAGDTIVAETGVLSGAWAATGQAIVTASGGAANTANPVGGVVNWNTGAVLFGHRVRGRTFLVPTIREFFDAGTLNNSVIGQVEAAATTMLNAVPGNFVVWSRPFAGTPAWTDVHGKTHPARAAHAGAASPISSASVPDLAAVLRSRRD